MAYTELKKLFEEYDKGKKLAIELHQSPDPDAIGAGLFMYEFAKKHEIDATMIYSGALSHPQNKILVKKLNITMQNVDKDFDTDAFFNYFYVDHSGKTSPLNPGIDKILGVIDHHDVQDFNLDVLYSDVQHVGSSSSICASYLKDGADELFDADELMRICTGLFMGLITDTANLRREATSLDREVHGYLNQYVDMEMLESIENPDWTKKWMDFYGRAINTRNTIDGTTIASVGYIEPDERDVIPMTADQLITERNVDTVYVMGIRSDIIDISIRTSDPTYDYVRLQRQFPEGRGGGKDTAGGLQIPNQFAEGSFISCCDRNKEKIEELIIEEFKTRILS